LLLVPRDHDTSNKCRKLVRFEQRSKLREPGVSQAPDGQQGDGRYNDAFPAG
jgi:hypothetical protein